MRRRGPNAEIAGSSPAEGAPRRSLPLYVDVTRVSEARCAGSSPAGGTNARVVQRPGRRPFKAHIRVRFPSRVLRKVRSAWCGHRSRKPGGAKASGFDSYAFHDFARFTATSPHAHQPAKLALQRPSRPSHSSVQPFRVSNAAELTRMVASANAGAPGSRPATTNAPLTRTRSFFSAPNRSSPTRKRRRRFDSCRRGNPRVVQR